MKNEMPQLVASDSRGRIFILPHKEAAGMKGGHYFRLSAEELIKLPPGSELFMLPDRIPVYYNSLEKCFKRIHENPLSKNREPCYAVAAFISPGFTATYASAYKEIKRPRILPLFSYAACAFYKGRFYVAALRVDKGLRHDSRFMDMGLVEKNAKRFKKTFPFNRLVPHLERCAFKYGCPNAKNFFLQRYEAPLPASPSCNARCAGCISYQPSGNCPATQPRITFVPTAEEIAQIALFHIDTVRDPIVSFGQGCEGEPLLSGDIIEQSIKMIRKKTRKGIININTNASKPSLVARLFDAGLDTIRVSMNSAREKFYRRYYKPNGYTFEDVVSSIDIAKEKGGFVSLNYLTMPGFTDSKDEVAALKRFIADHRVDMIQWRNLNYDPVRYFKELKNVFPENELLGIRETIDSIKKKFPHIMLGYFNPSKLQIRQSTLPCK